MGVRIVRFIDGNAVAWGVLGQSEISRITGEYVSLSALLVDGQSAIKEAATETQGGIPLESVTLLSPVTAPARIVCQGANYSAHRKEAGMEPTKPAFNLIFAKSDTSLTGPTDDIVRPSQVRLLDYEIEIGLVIGKPISSRVEITESNFTQYVAGIVIANDVSARDVQLVEGQWFKGKSYRTFCPMGPYLYLLDDHEGAIVHDLELRLSVNGEVRQSASTGQLLFKPEETLTELSEIMDFAPGDVILTGTPGGVALHLTGAELAQLNNPALSAAEKNDLLWRSQSERGAYLQDGDEVVCEVKSADGLIDLGRQQNRVVAGH